MSALQHRRPEADPADVDSADVDSANADSADADRALVEHVVQTPHGARVVAREHLPPAGTADGPTLVLAHGWCLTGGSWRPVVEQLQRRRPTTRVVTYDQPGHGASSLGRGPLEMSDLGDTLAAVLEQVVPDGEIVVGGHSMGGMTTMAFVGLRPDVVRERVVGVALVGTAADLTLRKALVGEGPVMRLLGRLPEGWGGLPQPDRMTRRSVFGADPDPDDVREVARMIRATPLRTVGQCFGAMGRMALLPGLTHLDGIPTVVLSGRRDRLTPVSWARRMAAAIPGVTMWVLPGKGHMLAYEATGTVVDKLQLLLDSSRRR